MWGYPRVRFSGRVISQGNKDASLRDIEWETEGGVATGQCLSSCDLTQPLHLGEP